MKWTKRMSQGIVGATAAAVALLSPAVLPIAQAAPLPGGAATASPPVNSGIPAFVDPDADLAARPAGSPAGYDSIFVTSWVKGGGHDYGIMVTILKDPSGSSKLAVSVSDQTSGWYKKYTAAIPSAAWSTTKLDIKTPGLTWSGSAQQMTIHATTPWGVIGLQLANHGPALNYAGNGMVQIFGSTNYQYALPNLSAAGTLTVDGKTAKVAGEAWLDRQWGPVTFTPTARWTWMNLNLSNGDKVAIWDNLNSTFESSWATVQHPDGSYELATVTPVAGEASSFWKSPVSGNTYANRVIVNIPSLHARLEVKVTGAREQEVYPGRVEATAAVNGFFAGQKVVGYGFLEEAGDFTS
ncbi:lipocalin-like domain-containing protein [Streptomyces sp. NPDC002787]